MRCKTTWQFLVVMILGIFIQTAQSKAKATNTEHRQQQQQQSGIGWAMQASAALTGGNPVSSISESGTVTLTIGGDQESGTISLQSSGLMINQLTITTGPGNRSGSRSWDGQSPSGQWTGLNGPPHQLKRFNCWTDAVWFFPALSLLTDYSDATLVFTDLGQQQYGGGTVEHIQVYRYYSQLPQDVQQALQRFSTVDYYLDSNTALPVAMAFPSFGEQDVNAAIPIAVVFAQYQSVYGVQVPMQVTELVNGSSFLSISITNAAPQH